MATAICKRDNNRIGVGAQIGRLSRVINDVDRLFDAERALGLGVGVGEGQPLIFQQNFSLILAGDSTVRDGCLECTGCRVSRDGYGDRIDCIIVVHAGDRGRLYLFDGVDVRSGSLEGQLAEGAGALTGDADFGWIRHGSTFTAGDLEGHAAIIDLRGIALGDFEPGERALPAAIVIITIGDVDGIVLIRVLDLAGGDLTGHGAAGAGNGGLPVVGIERFSLLDLPRRADREIFEFHICAGCGRPCGLTVFTKIQTAERAAERGVARILQRDLDPIAARIGVFRRSCFLGGVFHHLGDRQAADALVGDDDGGLAAEQACEVIAAQIGFQRRRRCVKRRLRNMEPEPARFGAPAVAGSMGRVAHGAVLCKLNRVQRQLDLFRGTGQVRIPAAAGGLHAGGGDVGEAVVDGVVGGEGGHGGNQGALRDVDGDAVVGGAGVGDDAMRIIHDHGDRRGVDRVARRGRALHKVVIARGEELLLLRREGCKAVVAGGHGIVGHGIGVDPIGAIGHRQGFCGIEIEDRAGQGLLRRAVIHLFHIEMVLDIGDIDGGGKLALKARAVDPAGIGYGSLRNGFGRGVEEGDGIGRVLPSLPIIVIPQVAGTVIKLSHPGAICRRLEDDAVFFIARRLDGAERGTDIAVCAARAACHLPAGQVAACDNAPLIHAGHRHAHADVVHTAHDDAEEQAFVFVKICRFRVGLILGCGHGDVGAGGNGFLGGRISTGGPTVIFVVEQDGLHTFAFQHKINALVVAIAVAGFVLLLENEVFDVALVQVVETDRDIVGIAEDKLAFFVRGAEADGFVAGLGILICTVALQLPLGRIERKRDIGKTLAVLVDFDAAGFGDVGQVEFHGQVGVGAAALEIEELQRVIGVVGKGVFAVGPIVVSVVFRHDGFEVGFAVARLIGAVDGNVPGGKVDGGEGLIMDAAEIGDENAVDEHPDIVVAGELEGHVFAVRLGRLAVVALDKARDHSHAKIVADRGIIRLGGGLGQGTVIECENRLRVGEREKLPVDARASAGFDSPFVVEREGVCLFIEAGIVRAFIFLLVDIVLVGIVVVIAVFANAQEPRNIPEGLLVGRCAAISTILVRFIEQIGQRGAPGRIAANGFTGGRAVDLARVQNGIAVGEPIPNDAGFRR